MLHIYIHTDSVYICWLRAGREGGNRGWVGWVASPTQWTWVWANSRRWWKTGKPSMLQSMESQSQTRLRDWAITIDCLLPGARNLAAKKIGHLLTGYKTSNKKLPGRKKCHEEINLRYVMRGDYGADWDEFMQEEVAVKWRIWMIGKEQLFKDLSLSLLHKWDHIILFSTCYFHFVMVISNID